MTRNTPGREPGWLWLVLQVIVLIVSVMVAGMLVYTSRPPEVSIILEPPTTATLAPTAAATQAVVGQPSEHTPSLVAVYVVGAVVQSGVVYLPENSLIDEAIRMAGGFSHNADTVAVNLAQPVSAGMQITVPTVSQDPVVRAQRTIPPIMPQTVTTFTFPAQSGNAVGGLLRINHATLEELQTLPGIGPVTAQNILDFRQTVGNIVSDADLLRVNGIGPGRFAEIRPLITYD